MAVPDISTVAELPPFKGLCANEIASMLAEARRISYPKGSEIFEQEEEARSFFVLLSGRLRLVRLTAAGQQVVVNYVAPGDIFGIGKMIGLPTYPATATAVIDSVALSWASSAWPALATRFPSLAFAALRSIGARLQDLQTRVVELATEEVERRVAHALLRLAKQAGRRSETGIEIDFPISRQDIAEMTGTTLHTVSRIVSGWECRGLVDSGRQRIVIKDAHKLFVLAEYGGSSSASGTPAPFVAAASPRRSKKEASSASCALQASATV